jgi:hypothetical protein
VTRPALTAAAMGAVFWITATHLYPVEEVGRDAALIAVLQAAGTAQLVRPDGAGTGGRSGGCVAPALTLGGGLGLAVVPIAAALSGRLAFIRSDPGVPLLLPLAAAGCALFAGVGAGLAAAGRAAATVAGSLAFGLTRTVVLILCAGTGIPHAVFLAWAGPVALLTGPACGWLLWRQETPAGVPGTPAGGTAVNSALAAGTGWDRAGALASRAGAAALPLAVLAACGPAATAAFRVGLAAALALDTLVWSVASTMAARSAGTATPGPIPVRAVLQRFGPLAATGLALGVLSAPLLLAPLGMRYVQDGTAALRLLLAAALPQAVLTLRCVLWRLSGRPGAGYAARLSALALLAVLLPPAVGRAGAAGAALAWLLAHLLMAGAVLPGLVREITAAKGPPNGSTAPGQPPGGRRDTDRVPGRVRPEHLVTQRAGDAEPVPLVAVMVQPVPAPDPPVVPGPGPHAGVDEEVRPVVGEGADPDAEHAGRGRRRREGGDGQRRRSGAEHLLRAQEHRVHARRVQMVLLMAPAGEPVPQCPQAAGRPRVQETAVDPPFDERLHGQAGRGDREVASARSAAGGTRHRQRGDTGQQHRRSWMADKPPGGHAQGGDLGSAAVRARRVEPTHHPRDHAGPPGTGRRRDFRAFPRLLQRPRLTLHRRRRPGGDMPEPPCGASSRTGQWDRPDAQNGTVE